MIDVERVWADIHWVALAVWTAGRLVLSDRPSNKEICSCYLQVLGSTCCLAVELRSQLVCLLQAQGTQAARKFAIVNSQKNSLRVGIYSFNLESYLRTLLTILEESLLSQEIALLTESE